MSANYTCTDCHHPIPGGQAVLRSISFERVAFCQPCAKDRGIVLPSQRSPLASEVERAVEEGVALAEAYANRGRVM